MNQATSPGGQNTQPGMPPGGQVPPVPLLTLAQQSQASGGGTVNGGADEGENLIGGASIEAPDGATTQDE